MTSTPHVYEVRPRMDRHGVALISYVPPFGRLRCDTPDNAIRYAKHSSRSHDAVIRVLRCGWQRDRNARAQGRFQRAMKCRDLNEQLRHNAIGDCDLVNVAPL